MTATELLDRLHRAGVELWADGSRLRYDAPADALDEATLERLRQHKLELLDLVRGPRRLPLGAAQLEFWLLDRLWHGHAGSHEQFVIRIAGEIDRERLAAAWRAVVARHPVLGSRFADEGGEVWQEPGAAAPIAPSLAGELDDAAWRQLATAESRRPFDLRCGPLLRPVLVPVGPRDHRLLVTAHHIVADGPSVAVIRDDLAALYAAPASGLPPVASPAARLPRGHDRDGRVQADVAWWRATLAGAPQGHGLPRSGVAGAMARESLRLPFAVEAPLARSLRRLAREQGCTVFTVLLAAWRVLLVRYSRERDVLVSVPVTLREDAADSRAVGCLINTLPLRTTVDEGMSFGGLLAAERDSVLGALAHRTAPLRDIAVALRAPGADPRRAISQLLFQFDSAPAGCVRGAVSWTIEPVCAPRDSWWDLECSLLDHGEGGGFAGHIGWATAVLDGNLVREMIGSYSRLLEAVAAAPATPVDELPLLDDAGRRRVLEECNTLAQAAPAGELSAVLAEALVARGEGIALEHGDARMGGAALLDRALCISNALVAAGVAPGDRVALDLPPSPDLVAALIGVIGAGAVAVPLDPSYPPARRDFIAADAGLAALIGAGASLPGVPRIDVYAPCPTEASLPALAADRAALLLYTSGSTGEPKGALLGTAAILNRCRWMWREYGFDAGERFCLRTSLNFVDSLWEIFGSLLHGVPLVILPAEVARDANRLGPALAASAVTHLVVVPSLLSALLDVAGSRLPALRRLVTSGEPLSPQLLDRARCSLPAVRILNTYGTSEIWDATCFDTTDIASGATRVPIGRPIPGMACYVLDDRMQPVPAGVAGELCVAGVGVGPGYWRRAALTAERYVDAPFQPGLRLYRTGDLARWLADGTLECLGRVDRQLKLRGWRIEPGEIESLLRRELPVRDAAVVLREEAGMAQLVAYVVPDAATLTSADCAARIAERLPGALCPAAWVVLDALPLTPSGKVDRVRLPAPSAALDIDVTPPADAVEQAIAAQFAARLGRSAVSRNQSFFDLGGESLAGMGVIARLNGHFGLELTLADLFAAPTVAGLAAVLRSRQPVVRLPLPVPAVADQLSYAQERLWFLDQLDPGSPAYNVAWTVLIDGPIEPALLQAAFAAAVARHPQLRAVFPASGGRPGTGELPAGCIRLAIESATPAERQVRRIALAREPFDLAHGPLVRATLFLDAGCPAEIVLVMHHAVTDGGSNAILFREIAEAAAVLGRGEELRWSPPAATYAQFAARQRTTAGETHLGWWLGRLRGAPAAIEWPTDHPRPPEQSFRGAWLRRSWGPRRARALRAYARHAGTTPYIVLLAALKSLAVRYTGGNDIVIGTPVSLRPSAELEGVVGLFVNTLALRTELSGDPSFTEILARVRATVEGALAHHELPFERLVAVLEPERSLSRAPVFQTLFNLVTMPQRSARVGAAQLRLGPLLDHGVAAFDLALTVGDFPDGLELVFEYATDLFREETVAALADAWEALLDDAMESPHRHLSALRVHGTDTSPILHGRRAGQGARLPVLERIAAITRSGPQAPALQLVDTVLTRAGLEEEASRVMRCLADRGIGRGQRVGLLLPREPVLVSALLGVLRAGAAYVVLDPGLPPARLAMLARDAELALILAGPDAAAAIAGVECVDMHGCDGGGTPASEVAPDDPACLVYTSGSTGEPKAVVVTHANLAATVEGWIDTWQLTPADVHLQMAASSFDVFNGDWLRALATGGRLVFCPREVLLDPPALHALIALAGVTVAEFVPAVLRPLLAWIGQVGERLDGLRLVAVGSERWQAEEYRALQALCRPDARVLNTYGVAEATIDSSWFEGVPDLRRPLPVGQPFPQARLAVVDERLRPAATGAVGELLIGGDGVAAGYWRRPDLSALRFVEVDGIGRAYRSGDRARLRADGLVELLGRADSQVKRRGFRLELGEVESALAALPGVAAAAVESREEQGVGQLCAWVEPRPGCLLQPDDLAAALRALLPQYALPDVVAVVARLPISPNGKIDRAALATPAPSRGAAGSDAPRDPVEALLAELYADVLGSGGPVGVHTDFFAAGGHSLLAARLVARIRETLGCELSLRALFDAPTVAGLAAALRSAPRAAAPAAVAVERPARIPLTPQQRRLWFLDQLEPGNAAWHIPVAWRLRGTVDESALERAFAAVAARHESLRTRFLAHEGEPFQLIEPGCGSTLQRLDVAPGAALDAALAVFVAQAFDLGRGPLWRALLARCGEAEAVLLVVLHHAIADGWSVGILAHEIGAAYAGQGARLPALPLQYADYAQWQEGLLSGSQLDAARRYWRAALAGAPAVMNLPLDRPRSVVASSRGAWHRFTIPAATVASLRRIAAEEHATLFMVLLAAYQSLLARWTGDEDLVIATPVAGRAATATEPMIGYFLNMLALRGDLSGNPAFGAVVGRARRTMLDAFAHAELPFEQVVELAAPRRSRAHQPLAQVLLVLHNQPRRALVLSGLSVEEQPLTGEAVKFDLALHVAEEGGSLAASFAFNTDLFHAGTIEDLAEGLVSLLDAAAADSRLALGDLPVCGPRALGRLAAERARVWPAPAASVTGSAGGTVLERIAAQVATRPQAPAVAAAGQCWSYAELWGRAGAIAAALPSGAGIAVLAGHDAGMVAAVLGVLRAGGAYVPVDPLLPAARQQALLRDVAAIVADPAHAEVARRLAGAVLPVIIAGGTAQWNGPTPTPGATAYRLHTSGTTGEPRGVEQTHAGLAAHAHAWSRQLALSPADRLALVAALGFDTATQDIFGALTSGACLEVVDLRASSPVGIVERLAAAGVTVLHLTPTLLRHLFAGEAAAAVPTVRLVVLGGEAALSSDFELFCRCFARGARLVNGLGLTESTTALQFFADHDTRIAGERLPVGSAVPGTLLRVEDSDGRESWCGELVLGGERIARYAGSPPLRELRTGDRLRRLSDGHWAHAGRLDRQLKLRGIRIEPSEVEAALRSVPTVRDAFVDVVAAGDGTQLVAWVVTAAAIDEPALRAALRGRLPAVSVPTRFIQLAELPRRPNGKLDSGALHAPPGRTAPAVALATPALGRLAELWEELLGCGPVPAEGDFFALGGHSLLAARLVARVRDIFAVELPLATIFDTPTLAAMAEAIRTSRAGSACALPPVRRLERRGESAP